MKTMHAIPLNDAHFNHRFRRCPCNPLVTKGAVLNEERCILVRHRYKDETNYVANELKIAGIKSNDAVFKLIAMEQT